LDKSNAFLSSKGGFKSIFAFGAGRLAAFSAEAFSSARISFCGISGIFCPISAVSLSLALSTLIV